MDIKYIFQFLIFFTGIFASCVFGKCVASSVVQERVTSPAILERKVEEGKTVKLECRSPEKTSINRQWIKNGLHLSSGAHGSLIIKNVRWNDSGLYHCKSNKQTVLISYRLKVIRKPVLRIDVYGENFMKLDKGSKVPLYSSVTLVCTVLSYPYPTAIWWQFDDTKFVYYKRSNDKSGVGRTDISECQLYKEDDTVDSSVGYYDYQENDTFTDDQVSYYIVNNALKCVNQTLELSLSMLLNSNVVFGEYTCGILYNNIEMSTSYNLQKLSQS